MNRKFDFKFKENMTKEELMAVLDQHKEFLGVDKLKEDLQKSNEMLVPFQAKEREGKLLKLIPKTGNVKLAKDIIKLSELSDDMDDEAITKAFSETIDSREYLKAPVLDDKAGKKEETLQKNIEEKKPKSDEELKKELKFSNL